MSPDRRTTETHAAAPHTASGSSNCEAPQSRWEANTEPCESAESTHSCVQAAASARLPAWQPAGVQDSAATTSQQYPGRAGSDGPRAVHSSRRQCAAQLRSPNPEQISCAQHAHTGLAATSVHWQSAGPIAEGKIAPYPEHLGEDYEADQDACSKQPAPSSGCDDSSPPMPWWRRAWRWCFPPMRPYADLCQGLSPSALFLLPLKSPVRRCFVYAVKSKFFERLSLLFILANCIFLAMDSNDPDFQYTHTGMVLRAAEWFFLVAFSVEMLLKVCALGLCQGASSYLRDPWNLIDSMVVIMGWISLSPKVANVSAMRTVRVLRPLRTITGVEGMRMLVATLLGSLPMLLDVLILNGFLFLIFGTVGLQTFMGMLRYECGTPVPGGTGELSDGTRVITNVTSYHAAKFNAPHVDDFVCGNNRISLPPDGGWFASDGALSLRHHQCGRTAYSILVAPAMWISVDHGARCNQAILLHVCVWLVASSVACTYPCKFRSTCSSAAGRSSPSAESGTGASCTQRADAEFGVYCFLGDWHSNPNFGLTSFDNILWAWLTIFQCVTLEGWTDVMYYVQVSLIDSVARDMRGN